jgi:hypothetical protein
MSDDEKELHAGDAVSWTTHGTTTHGTVQKKITERTDAAERTVAASEEEPQYLVQSNKSGKDAVHKPAALHQED